MVVAVSLGVWGVRPACSFGRPSTLSRLERWGGWRVCVLPALLQQGIPGPFKQRIGFFFRQASTFDLHAQAHPQGVQRLKIEIPGLLCRLRLCQSVQTAGSSQCGCSLSAARRGNDKKRARRQVTTQYIQCSFVSTLHCGRERGQGKRARAVRDSCLLCGSLHAGRRLHS